MHISTIFIGAHVDVGSLTRPIMRACYNLHGRVDHVLDNLDSPATSISSVDIVISLSTIDGGANA